jgi:hypothetical protein
MREILQTSHIVQNKSEVTTSAGGLISNNCGYDLGIIKYDCIQLVEIETVRFSQEMIISTRLYNMTSPKTLFLYCIFPSLLF